MGVPLTNLTNPNIITTDGSTVDATSWTTDWSTIVNYINSSLTASFNVVSNKGDIYAYTGLAIQALPVGSNGQALIANSAQPTGLQWSTVANLTTLTTNGDTLYYNGGANQRLPIGAPGQVLTVSGANLPAWASGSGITPGMIVIWSGSIGTIPVGWALCDGVSNASGINLQGLFVVGAGNASPAATGGMGLQNPGGPHGDNSAGAGLGPSHTHTNTGNPAQQGSNQAICWQTLPSSVATVTPKYYALCYIEKQ